MNTRRLRLVRPKWTLGTMLLVVGWSAVGVGLNTIPRHATLYGLEDRTAGYFTGFGYPWTYAVAPPYFPPSSPPGFRSADMISYWALAGNAAIGVLMVAVSTWGSKYLIRAIVAGLRAFVGKPPPSNEKGQGRASDRT